MIKDPFQTTKTPYETLGVPQNADSATITLAFKTALVKPGKAQESQDAHATLRNPLSRTVTDLFLYHEPYLKQLIPNIVGDELALIQNRDKIAQSWGNIQKQTFPNFAATHSLAILWYMWALNSEEIHYNAKEDLSSAPSLTQLWSNAIAHWVLLMNSHAFLNDYSKINNASNLNDNDIKELSSKLEVLFKKKLYFYKENYNQKGDKKSVERFEEYEHLFHSEMNAAKILALLSDKGIQFTNNVSNASICCGPIMLESVGILDHIRTQLDETIQRNQKNDDLNDDLRELQKILSPYARIFTLLGMRKYDEVLEAIESLSSEKQKDRELSQAYAKACLEKGKEEFLKNYDGSYGKSLKYLKRGLETGELFDEIIDAIVSNCKVKLNSVSNSHDEEIGILEITLKVVKNAGLEEILANKYTNRGIDHINKAKDKLEKSNKKPADFDTYTSEVEQGIEDLRSALDLNPYNRLARESLDIAEKTLETINSSKMQYIAENYTNKGIDRINKAQEKLEKSKKTDADFDTCILEIEQGIEDLRNALNVDSSNKRSHESLEIANKTLEAIRSYKKESQKQDEIYELNQKGVKLISEANILIQKKDNVEALIEAINKLNEAEKAFEAALKLDPKNSAIKANLVYVKKLLKPFNKAKQQNGFVYKTSKFIKGCLTLCLYFLYYGGWVVIPSYVIPHTLSYVSGILGIKLDDSTQNILSIVLFLLLVLIIIILYKLRELIKEPNEMLEYQYRRY